jgi:hypothetical protein
MERFSNALNFCNLQDLCFEGDVFTWRNNNFRVEGHIRECLDTAVANLAWCARFPGYKVVNGCPNTRIIDLYFSQLMGQTEGPDQDQTI